MQYSDCVGKVHPGLRIRTRFIKPTDTANGWNVALQAGSATVITALVVALAGAALVAVLGLAHVVTVRSRLQSTADFAAIAAAQATFEPYMSRWDPCTAAREVAEANQAQLVSCITDANHQSAQVQVSIKLGFKLGWTLKANARAG